MPNTSSFNHATSSAAGRTTRKLTSDKISRHKKEIPTSLSTLTFEHVSALSDPSELEHLIHNAIEKNGRHTLSIIEGVETQGDRVVYSFTTEKRMLISIAHKVADAFKHLHPRVDVHNPRDNVYYRITVTFSDEA